MTFHFGNVEKYHAGRYDGQNDLSDHLIECQTLWELRPKDEWVHDFIHTLDEMPRSEYELVELRRDITTLEERTICFAQTFHFVDTNPNVNNALQIIQAVVLNVVLVAYPMDPHVQFNM